MAYSRYYATIVASDPGGVLTHVVANPDNNTFGIIADAHLQVAVSVPGQTLAAFQALVAAGRYTVLQLNNDYSLINNTITTALTLEAGGTYRVYLNRVTPKNAHVVDFQAGSPLTETDLDNSNRYTLFRSQELEADMAVVSSAAAASSYTLTLAEMNSVAGIAGAFVGYTDTQNIENKTFAADKGNLFDCGGRSWTA